MKLKLIFIACLISTAAQSQVAKLYNPPSVSPARSYSHVAEIDLGTCRMLLISGQVALDVQGNLVGKDDVAKQSEQVFTNIKNIVEGAGGKMEHVVKLGVFMLDVSKIQAFRDARDKFVNTKTPPASTLVGVTKLAREDLLIEVEATVVIPK